MTTFLAPSSYGEALDRLTILQLKLDYITDKRRDDVQVEFNDLQKTRLESAFKTQSDVMMQKGFNDFALAHEMNSAGHFFN